MAHIGALRGLRYDPARVDLGRVLAPPYDVIGPAQRLELYARDPHNAVRVESGEKRAGDEPGRRDRYTRARAHLISWLEQGILRRDPTPCLYVTVHRFTTPGGSSRSRRGIFARIPARPWEEAEIRPHERTLRGPKEDRLALLRATSTQTSPVFGMWAGARGIGEVLDRVTDSPPSASGETPGELGPEAHALWVVADRGVAADIAEALGPARLYVADGHHRYETAVAYARERRAADPAAPPGGDVERCLVHLCAAGDSALVILPTHRLVPPAEGVPAAIAEAGARLEERGWELRAADNLPRAMRVAAALRPTHHACGLIAHDGVLVVSRPRDEAAGPRDGLDVVVLEEDLLPALGVPPGSGDEGRLTYGRDLQEVAVAVRGGRASLGVALNPCSAEDVTAVCDRGETMPQKSTYFYPKVPTGLVLSPLGPLV